jgi:hypothetical protein
MKYLDAILDVRGTELLGLTSIYMNSQSDETWSMCGISLRDVITPNGSLGLCLIIMIVTCALPNFFVACFNLSMRIN